MQFNYFCTKLLLNSIISSNNLIYAMKRNTVFLLLVVIFMFSCNSDFDTENKNEVKIEDKKDTSTEKKAPEKIDTKSIIGKWKTDFEGTVAELSDEKKLKMAEALPQFKQTFAGIVYEYKENGSYLHNGGIAPVEGMTKWEISGNKLEIKEGGELVFSYEIVELNAERMVLKSNDEGEIFPVTVYSKIK